MLTTDKIVGRYRRGLVYTDQSKEHVLYVCAVPLKDGNRLLLKGSDAIIASLFGELENGGVVYKDTLISLATLRKKDIARKVRRVAKQLEIAGVSIHEIDDKVGFYIQATESSGISIVESQLKRCPVEDAFKGILNLSEPNTKPVIICSKNELESAAWESSYTVVNNRRAQEGLNEIREMNRYLPKLGKQGYWRRRHGKQGKGRYARI